MICSYKRHLLCQRTYQVSTFVIAKWFTVTKYIYCGKNTYQVSTLFGKIIYSDKKHLLWQNTYQVSTFVAAKWFIMTKDIYCGKTLTKYQLLSLQNDLQWQKTFTVAKHLPSINFCHCKMICRDKRHLLCQRTYQVSTFVGNMIYSDKKHLPWQNTYQVSTFVIAKWFAVTKDIYYVKELTKYQHLLLQNGLQCPKILIVAKGLFIGKTSFVLQKNFTVAKLSYCGKQFYNDKIYF